MIFFFFFIADNEATVRALDVRPKKLPALSPPGPGGLVGNQDFLTVLRTERNKEFPRLVIEVHPQQLSGITCLCLKVTWGLPRSFQDLVHALKLKLIDEILIRTRINSSNW